VEQTTVAALAECAGKGAPKAIATPLIEANIPRTLIHPSIVGSPKGVLILLSALPPFIDRRRSRQRDPIRRTAATL